MASKKRYWRSVEELENSSLTEELAQNEFHEELPIDGFLEKADAMESSKTSRRDFLKFLGFSTAAATLAACEAPIVKSVPYVVKPDEITPGMPTFYATTMYDGYDYASVLVRTREGRPIRIEPRKDVEYFGGTNTRVQASVLSLYDSNRVQAPQINKKKATWEQIDVVVAKKLNSLAGKKAVLLTPSLPSPSTKKLIQDFTNKYQSVEHVIFDAVDYSPALDASEEVFGKRVLPYYDISKTELVVSFAADFLNDWNGTDLEKEYAIAKKPGEKMIRHIQVEANLSLTGSNADTRIPMKPTKINELLVDVYNGVVNDSASSEVGKKIVGELKVKGSKAVVFADGTKEAYVLAYLINQSLSSSAFTGKEVTLKESNNKKFNTFVDDAKSGKVEALFIYDCDPVNKSSRGAELSEALKSIPLSVAMVENHTETSASVNVLAPVPNWLESWGDFSPMTGVYSLQQPTIQPIFKTRQLQDSLIKWTGEAPKVEGVGEIGEVKSDSLQVEGMIESALNIKTDNYYTFLRKYWKQNVLTEGVKFNQALYDGVFVKEVTTSLAYIGGNSGEAVAKLNSLKSNGWELQLYTKIGMGDGKQATNPWLQEFPDPITRTAWDNYFTMNPLDADKLGIKMWNQGNERNGRMQFDGPYYSVNVGDKTITAPVFVQPGQAQGTLGLALGYGVKGRIAKANDLEQIGVNAYPIYINGQKSYQISEPSSAGGVHEFACVQMMNTLMGRYEIAREATLEDYLKPEDAHKWNEQPTMDTFAGKGTPVEEVNLWRNFDRSPGTGPHFKLSVDLNACTGCGACIIACHAENNVPVVGKDEVRRFRDMAWLRIDRYYSDQMQQDRPEVYPYTQEEALKDKTLNEPQQYKILISPASENPDVIFQPMMCQHCNHAPCETVCPVAATSHGRQGQNMMAYNRCVGTRYCANNCPYKVRRFNWFNYAENDSFDFNMNNDLGRMVLNPDVVVRQRGVMEKCSFCIQSTQAAILEAKKDGRVVTDEEFNNSCACSTACSSNAMRFGDVNDENSMVAKLENDIRKYEVLEEVGTQPNIFYHVKIRNRNNKEY